LGKQRIQGSANVQIQDVERSHIQITYGGASRTVPLEPATIPVGPRLPSPARLVRAHSGVVPYVERAGLLAGLGDWIDGEAPFSGQVIGGRGGSGKTRLAVQACEEVRADGWLCGFLTRAADPGMLDALVGAPTARLVVIDYAETRAEQVELLLPLLRENATADAPVRVLLLARTSSARPEEWPGQLGNRIDALDALLDECEVRLLEEAPFSLAERERLFAVAAESFHGWLGLGAPMAAPPRLADGSFESPLMVVIAAYLAAHGEESPTTRERLLDEVLAHERRYWRDSAAGLGADVDLLERVVAVATLLEVESEGQAVEAIRIVPDLADASAERRGRLARWVRGSYPGPRWWNPLEPDPVGEHLVAKCFDGHPEALRKVLGGGAPEEITRPLEVLGRAAVDHPELAGVLGRILGEELPRLVEVAVRQAEGLRDADLLYGSSSTVAAAVDGAVSSVAVDPRALPAAIAHLPPRADIVLSELAATLALQDVERRLRPAVAAEPGLLPTLASGLNNLSNRLCDVGRFTEALATIEGSVVVTRSLAESDRDVFGEALAMALNNYANCLSELGRFDEALAAIEESVAILRGSTATDPGLRDDHLAAGLHNLSSQLGSVGRFEEALVAARECVDLCRRLAAADPAVGRPDLAWGLGGLSIRLGDVGRREESVAAVEESVELLRPLAAANPAAYATDLAGALNNLTGRLGSVGRREESIDAIEECVALYRALAGGNPAAYNRELAGALNNLSNQLGYVGRGEEALVAAEESVEVFRALAAMNPVAYEADLAIGLNSLSSRLGDLERVDESLAAIEECVGIRRRLVAAQPAAHTPDLASALNNLAARLSEADRDEEALAVIQESVGIRRRLFAANPAAHEHELAGALNNLSNGLGRVGRDEEALAAIEESVEVYRRLIAADPGWGGELAIALRNRARFLRATGREEEAERDLREADAVAG
jgi:tetratricopeptide (TPR) repeat protein